MLKPRSLLCQSFRPASAGWRQLAWIAALWFLTTAGGSAQSLGEPIHAYDLPASPASSALRQFARQSGLQVVFTTEAVRGVRLNAVKDVLPAREALARLLQGSVLIATEDNGAFAISRRPPEARRETRRLPSSADEAVNLNPFEVRTDQDRGYGALSSNALTSFSADLQRLPVSAEVFTRTFIDDIDAISIEEMLVNYGGTAGFTGSAVNAAPGDRDGIGGLSVRGMSLPSLKRDGFVGPRTNVRNFSGSTDNFSTERVELLEGPQSLLYGGSGGGGVVNVVPKEAGFGRVRTEIRHTLDNYGSKRVLFDTNVGGSDLAARVVATTRETRSARFNLSSRLQGLYGQLAWRPAASTTVRLWGEFTDSTINNAVTPDLTLFLPEGDPRLGRDARYLVLTGQAGDIEAIDGGLNYGNVESLAGWWSSERIVNSFAGLTVESRLTRSLSGQLSLLYGETEDARIRPNRTLVPAGVVENPFAETAMSVTPADNQQPHRVKGIRAMLLAEHHFLDGRVRSQTAVGAESLSFTDVDSVDYRYYLADENWQVAIDPSLIAEYGRTPLGPQYFPVGRRIERRPLFRPESGRITVEGRNYVRMSRILADPTTATPANPLGLIPNNPGVGNGFAGNHAHGETRSRGLFAANFTDWLDGRFTTLAGIRFTQSHTLNAGAQGVSYREPWDEAVTGNLGLTARLRPSLQAYASLSSSYTPLQAQTRDLTGDQLRQVTAESPLPEAGLKFQTEDARLVATLALHPATTQRNEAVSVDASFLDAVNPEGINGRLGTPDRWVNLDRRSRGASLRITASPTPAWRLRFSLAWLDGEATGTVRFRQHYNDQFHTDGQGGVIYRDGTPVFVDPTGANGTASIPLTLAMLNDPASPFYASPDPDSGRITGVLAREALTHRHPQHGQAATGATGLPISDIQYAWSDPNQHAGEITVFQPGEKSTGFNELTANIQNHYTFPSGPLKGLGIFLDVRTYLRNRGYYVQRTAPGDRAVNAERSLYRLPNITLTSLGLSYRMRLSERTTWTTQINVHNLFDHSRVWVVPDPVNGTYTQARLSAQPRMISWSNTIRF